MPPVIPDAISITGAGEAPLSISPRQFDIDADAFGLPVDERAGVFRLIASNGWTVAAIGPLRWRLTAYEIDLDVPLTITLRCMSRSGVEQEWTLAIPIALDLASTFDPVAHTFPEPNRASVLGDVFPERQLFDLTYVSTPDLLADALFRGLYADIVFLRHDGPTRGGLCSGMARWAIARAVGAEPAPADREDALDRIVTYHGRQLCDRALARGLRWFLRGSPRAAYRIVRNDLLMYGATDRAFDIAIPKPWRRDVIPALIREGHTVVPYRLRQATGDRAFVEVYDPNRPPATLETPEAIEFDLKRDRYRYRHMVSMDQSNVGIIAASQAAYAKPGTAIMAGLASLGMSVMRRMLASTRPPTRGGIPGKNNARASTAQALRSRR